MRYTYYYKTSDNVRHEAEISAPGRDEAFATLRKRGIRPIKVVPQEEETGDARHVKGTFILGFALAAMVFAGAVAFALRRETERPANEVLTDGSSSSPYQAVRGGGRSSEAARTGNGPRRSVIESNVVELRADGARPATPRPRRFIPELADGVSCTSCLKRVSERLLALFAMPGEPLPDDLPSVTEALTKDLYESLGNGVIVEPGDSAGVAELKGIVVRLKDEAEVYLGTGRGLSDYIAYLKQRQRMEVRYREDIMRDYSAEEAAEMLRAMGFRQPGEDQDAADTGH